ncbi:MAG: radical SAM protein [Lachnospiraceae bacterium]|nr:radical SAM protein [Lachnospiraceae bacterium]
MRKTKQEVENSPRKMLTKEQWLSVARQAKEEGMLYLLLTGGEPLLWPDFWELYEELIQMGLLVSINTNGSMIDEAAVERFKKYPPNRINITLYGGNDDTYYDLCQTRYVYERVDRAINMLQKAHIQVKLNGSLTPDNIHDLAEMVAYAERKGLIYEPVTYMFPPIRRDENLVGQNERFTPKEAAHHNGEAFRLRFGEEMFQKRMRSIIEGTVPPPGLDENCIDPMDGTVRCRAGKASFWITWDGLIGPCGMMTKPMLELNYESFKTTWEELVQVTNDIRLSGICTKCENQKLCHSCAAMALAETGSHEGIPTYLCEMVDEMKKYAKEHIHINVHNTTTYK